tara:strand:- start:73 stop:306 length:234 start_codon:yes stop_codon:yes gene_type:complete
MKIDKTDDHELKLESARVREIVREILDFGVNDSQIRKIIKFLSLELESRALMIEIVDIIDKSFEDTEKAQKKIKIEV